MQIPCLSNLSVPLRNGDHYSGTVSSDRDVWNFGYRIKILFNLENTTQVVGVERFHSITPSVLARPVEIEPKNC